jgi:hypothetical protein
MGRRGGHPSLNERIPRRPSRRAAVCNSLQRSPTLWRLSPSCTGYEKPLFDGGLRHLLLSAESAPDCAAANQRPVPMVN